MSSLDKYKNGPYGLNDIADAVFIAGLPDVKALADAPKIPGARYETVSFWPDLGIGRAVRVWNPDRPKSEHDGGNYLDPDKLNDLGLRTDADPFGTYFTPSPTETGCFDLVSVLNDVSVFGALPFAAFDNAKPFQACGDSTGLIPLPYSLLPFELTKFESTATIRVTAPQGRAYVKLQDDAAAFGFLVQHADSYFDGNIEIDCNSTGRGGVQVIGANDSEIHVKAKNVQARNGGSTVLAGLHIGNSNRVIYSADCRDFTNLDQPNESLPRVANLTGACDGCRGGTVKGHSIDGAGLLDYSGGRNTVDVLNLTLCGDNGIYTSSSTELHVGQMTYSGSEESIVSLGGSKVHVGNLTVRGECASVLNVSEADSISVDHLHFEKGSKASTIARVRPGNVNSGSIFIGKLTGSSNLQRLLAFDTANGAIESFVIESGDFEYIYDPNSTGTLSQWADLRAVGWFNLKNLNVTVRHITGGVIPGTDIFFLEVNPSQLSLYDNVKVFMPDGGVYRGRVAVQNVYKNCGNWQINIGPYCRENGYVAPFNAIAAIPTIGYWHKGERYITDAGDEVVCTVSGANGATWATLAYTA